MLRLGPDQIDASERRTTLGAAGAPTPPAGRDPAAELKQQRIRIFEQAREEGRAAGLKEAELEIARQVEVDRLKLEAGHRAAVTALNAEREVLQAMGGALSSAAKMQLEQAEALAAEVAFAAVTRLLGDRLSRADLMAALCGEIIREFGQNEATLRVGERDLEVLSAIQLDVPLVLDRRLAPGECVMDTSRGQFASGLDVRLEGLKQALLQALKSEDAQ